MGVHGLETVLRDLTSCGISIAPWGGVHGRTGDRRKSAISLAANYGATSVAPMIFAARGSLCLLHGDDNIRQRDGASLDTDIARVAVEPVVASVDYAE